MLAAGEATVGVGMTQRRTRCNWDEEFVNNSLAARIA
jgi:hypothetical protein